MWATTEAGETVHSLPRKWDGQKNKCSSKDAQSGTINLRFFDFQVGAKVTTAQHHTWKLFFFLF